MLKVKHLTLFKQKKWKKVGIFTTVAKKIEFCSIFIYNLVSRFSLILTKIWFSVECKWF